MTNMIDALVEDLTPVRRMDRRHGWLLAGVGMTAAVIAVATSIGLRPDVVAGNPAGIIVLRAGTLLVLAAAALSAAIMSVQPTLGRGAGHGWHWALAAALLFPASALIGVILRGTLPLDDLTASSARWCLGVSSMLAFGIAAIMTGWLRKGAVVRPERTGWLTGMGAGALGTMAYSLHCPSLTISYIGIWYSLSVAISAVAGRLIIPRFLRW